MTSGIKITEETAGIGEGAAIGDVVSFRCIGFLNRGELLHETLEQQVRLGSRQMISGIEKALIGMRVGGYRKVRISPHLAYGEAGVEGKVPANAVLVYELWLDSVQK